MKRILLILAVVLFVTNASAQTPLPITGLTTVCVGSTITLSDATPAGTWTSSNPSLASVGSTGIVTGVGMGVAVISYSTGTGFATQPVTINPVPFPISGTASICTGGTATFTDGTALGTWSTSFITIASVDAGTGLVSGVSGGVDTIYYTLTTGCMAKATVTVNSTAISGTTTVCLGGASSLLTDATPGGTWTSSNPGVASIGASSGVLTGVSAGGVGITYTIGPGCVGYTTAFVRSLPVITPATISGCVGKTYLYTAVPDGGGWVSSNPLVATVNYVGAVTAVAAGSATIFYTAPGGCMSSAIINVNPLPLPVTGINFVYSGSSTPLYDLTPGGNWSTGNASLATISPSGVVTGVSSGLVLMSYTIPSTGCASVYRIDVNPLPGTTNLVAWYPFCGDTIDHSGFGHDLLNFIGTPATLTADRFLVPNNAYEFSGGNCIMEYSTFFPNSGTPNDFTYSCWINPTGPQSSIVWYNGNPNFDGFGVVMNDGTGFPGGPGLDVHVLFGGIGQSLSTTITPGIWSNIVVVKNGNFYYMYVNNGPATFFGPSAVNPMSVGSLFAVGGNSAGAPLGNLGFIGGIDDIAVIEKQLNAAERSSAYFFNPDAQNFTLGADTVVCSDAIKLAPNPQTIGAVYTWKMFTTGFGYVVTDTVDTSLVVYPVQGILGNSYSLTISKPYGCSSADTITVYKSPIPVNLGPDQYVCIGDTVTLTSFFPTSKFLWSTGDTTHFIHVTSTGVYYLTVDSIVHLGTGDSAVCVGRDTIYVHTAPVPILTVPATVAECHGNTLNIFTHSDPTYHYTWSNGYLGDSTFISVSGTYWIRVSDDAFGGCVRSDTIRATIIDESVNLISVDTALCKGDQIPIKASFNPVVTYQWTPTDGMMTSNLPVVFVRPDTSAEYYLTISYPGCPNIVDSFHIDVQPIPTVNIGGNRDVCEGDTIHITANVVPGWYQHYHYVWTPANSKLNAIDSSTVIFHAFTSHDSEELILKVYPPVFLSGAAPQCYAMDSAAIFVHPRFIDSMLSKYDFCPGDSIQFSPIPDFNSTNLGVIISSIVWTPSTYLDNPGSQTPWIHPITNIGYRYIAYSQFGCADTEYVSVVVHPAAVINLGDSVVIAPGESYHIQPQTNCVTFLWYPPLGLDGTHGSDPLATPDVNTVYTVGAATEDGCTVTDSIKIKVDLGNLIQMPNAFTPDGTVNNVFSVLKHGLVGLNYFRVFDRWGVKVFETKNISEGWNGKFNGAIQPAGVYVYDVEAVSNTGRIFHRQGNVTLIK